MRVFITKLVQTVIFLRFNIDSKKKIKYYWNYKKKPAIRKANKPGCHE
jgi:hypothetical protein